MTQTPLPPSDADLLRAYLADRDVSCPVCGYGLRGLASGRCSECGTDLRLHVHPIVRFSWSYAIGVFGGVVGLVLAMMAFAAAFLPAGRWAVVPGATLAAGAAVQLFVWDKYHRRMMKRWREWRVLFVVGTWGIAVLSLGLMAAVVMG